MEHNLKNNQGNNRKQTIRLICDDDTNFPSVTLTFSFIELFCSILEGSTTLKRPDLESSAKSPTLLVPSSSYEREESAGESLSVAFT